MIKSFFDGKSLLSPWVAILLVVAVVAAVNFQGGVFLAGWDNLLTELNPKLGVERAWYSTWQEYQSFGLPAGMAHGADLSRAVVTLILVWILPVESVRFIFMFGMVLFGSLGVVRLLKSVDVGKKSNLSLVIASLGYVLTLPVLQLMFLPFEPFAIMVAALPWQMCIFFRLLDRKSDLAGWVLFCVLNFLAGGYAVLQQLFAVYILSLVVCGSVYLFWHFNARKVALLVALISSVLVINAYWIFPQVYFLATSAEVIKSSKINQLATEDVIFQNRDFGNIADFIFQRGVYFQNESRDGSKLFQVWLEHQDSVGYRASLALWVSLMLIGILVKSRYRWEFLALYILVLVALLPEAVGFKEINSVLRSNEWVNQTFRSTFTKFGILRGLVESYFVAVGISFLVGERRRVFAVFFWLVCALMLLGLSWPSFTGRYFSDEMKVKVPGRYFDFMKYMSSVDSTKRIALLPEYTHWGWFHYDWGYNGSGFLWYGLKQPVVSRTFDVWSTVSESYFWEMKNALEKESVGEIETVLDKYRVDYLLLDESVQPLVSTTRALQTDRTIALLDSSRRISLVKDFGKLKLYSYNGRNQASKFVEVFEDLPNVGASVDLMGRDVLYRRLGNYQSDNLLPWLGHAPFVDLISQTKLYSKNWILQNDTDQWMLKANVPQGYGVLGTKRYVHKYVMPVGDNLAIKESGYYLSGEENSVVIRVPKILIRKYNLGEYASKSCFGHLGEVKTQDLGVGGVNIKTADGSWGCFRVDDMSLPQNFGYLVRINSKNISGKRLYFYLQDTTKDQSYIEERLNDGENLFLIEPRFEYGVGYSFVFQNESLHSIEGENVLESVEVYAFPFEQIRSLYLASGASGRNWGGKEGMDVEKTGYHRYDISLWGSGISGDKYLLLSQASSEGWIAYGKEPLRRTKVDNWANGWFVPGGIQNITIIYWPQYLQYFGFVLGMLFMFGLGGIWVVRHFKNPRVV